MRNMLKIMGLYAVLLGPWAGFSHASEVSIPLTVHEALRTKIVGIDRVREPVSVGIPFPKGVLFEKKGVPQLGLEGAGEYQFRTLAKWPDGSVRWALVDFQASLKAERAAKGISVIQGEGNSEGTLASEDDGFITVNTGVMTARIRKKRFNLFDRVTVNGVEIMSKGSQGIVVMGEQGVEYSPGNDSKVVVEENGPLRTVVKAEGTHVSNGKRMMDYTVRMHFYKNLTRVKVVYTLRNASQKQFEHAYIRSLDLVGSLSPKGPYRVQVTGHDKIVKEQLSRVDEKVACYQAVSDFPQDYAGDSFYYHAPIPPDYSREKQRGFLQEGYWIRKGDTTLATGGKGEFPDLSFLDISNESGVGVTVGVRYASGHWPKTLRASGDGTFEVSLWPRENDVGYWIRYGSHNTFEVMYDFHDRQNDPAASMKRFQYPLVAKAPVDWYNRNVQGIYPLYNFVSFADEKKYVRERGWEDDVSWRKPRMKVWRYHYWGWGGPFNQHDFARIGMVNFLRETEDFRKAGEYYLYSEARFDYNADWAVYHSDDYLCTACTNRGYDPEKNKDKAELSKVVFEIEHIHWYGLPLYYYMTGDERAREAILDWGEILKIWSQKAVWVYDRFFGWEMYSLAAMYDFTGDPSYIKLADQIFEKFLSLEKDNVNPWKNIYIDWDRGFVMRGDDKLKPGLMMGYIIFDGLYNYYLLMDDKNPLKERVADVLEGLSEFMYREPYIEGTKKTPKGDKWAFWLPYEYSINDKSKSNHSYRLILQAFYVNLAQYLLNGESRWLERMDKIIRSAAWDEAGVWSDFGYMDHPGLQSILYSRLHPRDAGEQPLPVQDLRAELTNKKILVKWTAPKGAVRYQIKYSTKKLVESLEFDPDKRTYKYDPSEYANWWAGKNLPDEPLPGKPGEVQNYTVKGLKPGRYYFSIRSWDAASNRSRISNVAEVEVP